MCCVSGTHGDCAVVESVKVNIRLENALSLGNTLAHHWIGTHINKLKRSSTNNGFGEPNKICL